MKVSEEVKARVEELHQQRRAIEHQIKSDHALVGLTRLRRQLESTVKKIRRIESGMPEDDLDDLPI